MGHYSVPLPVSAAAAADVVVARACARDVCRLVRATTHHPTPRWRRTSDDEEEESDVCFHFGRSPLSPSLSSHGCNKALGPMEFVRGSREGRVHQLTSTFSIGRIDKRGSRFEMEWSGEVNPSFDRHSKLKTTFMQFQRRILALAASHSPSVIPKLLLCYALFVSFS